MIFRSNCARGYIAGRRVEMNKYPVSVIVSTYSSEAFIRECLQDLTRQTIIDKMEIVIVDAASPQNERAVVEEFRRQWPNIKYIRTESRVGIYAAWNIAIKYSSGTYIMPFSTNDRLSANACEILSGELEEHSDIALVYGDTYLTDTPHETFEKHNRVGKYAWPSYSYEDLLQNCRVGPHPMWRRSVHGELGYYNENFVALGDYEFWLRLGEKCSMLHIPAVTGLYWMEPESLSLNKKDSEKEIAECREIYQRRYLKRLNCADEDCRIELSQEDKGIFEDRPRFVLDSGHSADHIFCRYYAGTKAKVYIRKEDLQWFYDINFVDSKWLSSCIAGLYCLAGTSLDAVQEGGETLSALRSFVSAFGRGLKSVPSRHEKMKRSRCNDIDLIMKNILDDSSEARERGYEFKKNFLIPEFMRQLEQFGKYMCERPLILTERKDSFSRGIWGIFAMIAGESLGSFYLYSESLNRLTADVIRTDRIIDKRAFCHKE